MAATAVLALLSAGFLLPEGLRIPVSGATPADWNHDTFWHQPWGVSGVHKGIDIFADEGTPVIAATPGLVLYSGKLRIGGNVVVIAGPKWRVHYYAHMQGTEVGTGAWVSGGEAIGRVGTTGNAAGKPPHLHYSIVTAVPYPWRVRAEKQGWKKIFHLDPHARLISGFRGGNGGHESR